MIAGTVEALGQALADRLRRDDDCVALSVQLVRLLAEGQPVSRARLATALGVSPDAVAATLRRMPNVAYDDQGRIVASGLSLLPTPHHVRVNRHALYAWCALDTLLFPILLGQRARVTSRCPVSGTWVRLTVTPQRIARLDHADALVSVVVPDAAAACGDVRGVFCNHVHFFSGPEAGARWRATHPEASLLSVEEALAVAHLLAPTRYGLGMA